MRDHHVGYIHWATYEENRRMMRRNSVNWEGGESMAAIRAGQSLLVGLLIVDASCMSGIGGVAAPMHATFARATMMMAGQYCIGFGGSSVDRRVGQELLALRCDHQHFFRGCAAARDTATCSRASRTITPNSRPGSSRWSARGRAVAMWDLRWGWPSGIRRCLDHGRPALRLDRHRRAPRNDWIPPPIRRQ
jgi:hypothetical protein